ncbi:hypothetical protein PO909_006377 [Leuciscus waleckii]
MSSKSARICFAYENPKEFICKTSGKKKHSVDCKFCKTTLTDVSGTTSNFYRHVQRKHKESNESPDSVKKFREDLKRTLIDTLTAEVEATADGDMLHSGGDADETTDSPPGKCPRLLARYRAHKHLSHSAKDACISAQIHKYFDAIQDTDTNTALEFWSTNRERFPQIYSLVVKVLSIPASSAPVERVFSKGGLIVRPHHARLTHKMVKW